MKYFTVLFLIVLMAGCGGSQPETDPAINIPADEILSGVNAPNLTAGIDLANQNVCRTNMLAISSAISMYQVQHGELPSSLEEVGSSICPDGGSYRYTVSGQNWTVNCPASPAHGSVSNGTSSW